MPKLLMVTLAGLVVVACARGPSAALPSQGVCTALPPAPPDVNPLSTDPAVRRQILNFIDNNLQFLPAASPTGEDRELTVVTTQGPPPQRRFGLAVRAAIQPEQCSYLNDRSDLENSRRVVARLFLQGASYPKLRLPAGESFLWVDTLRQVPPQNQWFARGVVIPRAPGIPAVEVRIRFEEHTNLPVRTFPEARWLFTPQDDDLWESCAKFGCCYVERGQPGDTVRT